MKRVRIKNERKGHHFLDFLEKVKKIMKVLMK
jgi:hypothetical protein